MKKYDTAKSKYDKELIDTLWNVNTTGQRVGDVYNMN